ncbi:arylsulfatase [Rhodopseudomonas thermotolerans]|uniref:Arylsulfatase n=2 Tax=Rhodopseudomonas TaxID=1073 RepID=A0A336K085_9BRAD|nr:MULTISPECIES: arylsulfatase [Rhodopseudomonas]RED32029.1 arylsulfatase [Rhodopseudomonas pentothenatexigens]REF93410.1 arylsulfatase [Rhodopseudomonas thermotolerans]SSW91701.1 arylsulfatase [Rhodopseudomonas pentothenatexigens]
MSATNQKTFGGRIGRTIADSKPWWPEPPSAPAGAPNILVVLFDDVGFSDFGCYGSPIATPTIDQLAAEGLRYTGFHTTAMCSTTRAALLTGRNHHSVGVGCLANFDSGYPGYRGKIAKEAGTLAEMLRAHAYRNYMVGKWHVTPLTETGATGPFDGWPLGRGFDRFYGFLDAETDQFSPELVSDNTPIDAPGTYETGYHLTEDLIDQAIRFIADHAADRPELPWLTWVALGACHAPHQAPMDIIKGYDATFAHGWDVEREQRIARQKAMGIVPETTDMPPRNDGVKPWNEHTPDEQRVFTRLQAAFAGMLDHADRHLKRLVDFLDASGQRDNTLILVLSDNGASQEGGPLGFINAMGPYNFRLEPMPDKIKKIDDIGGPNSHSNFPHGWAMASNTPLRRYKQNTHGGGIRDPFVVSWPTRLPARGELRHQFVHASDLVPTLLELIGVEAPAEIGGLKQMPLEGESFARSLTEPGVPSKSSPQYFEMFGHRGIWHQGWKAVAYHPPGKPFDDDKWELFHLDRDFSEAHDLAEAEPARLAELIEMWWAAAERHQVLPLDDRFGPRFAENAARFHGARKNFVFHRGMGHVPTDVAPDVRSRSYTIEAHIELEAASEGVLISHGDMTSGYSLYIKDGRLVHDLNIGGHHHVVTSERTLQPGPRRLGVKVERLRRTEPPAKGSRTGVSRYTLTIDGEPAGSMETGLAFHTLISWSGLDIGRDRGSPVSHYDAPFEFTGRMLRVEVSMFTDQDLDGEAVGNVEMARQ